MIISVFLQQIEKIQCIYLPYVLELDISSLIYLNLSLVNREGGFRNTQNPRETSTNNLNTGDIEKARPYYHGYQYTNKESFVNRNEDINGSIPRKLHQPLNKAYYTMRTDDIKGAHPQAHKFETLRQPSNPLNPEYKLPYAEIRTSTPPKFIRDNLNLKVSFK